MNKIFKLKSRGNKCVVVSEIASSKDKTKNTVVGSGFGISTICKSGYLACMLALVFATNANAVNFKTDKAIAYGDRDVAIGENAIVGYSYDGRQWYQVFNSIAIGYGAKAKSNSSLSIGENAGDAFVGYLDGKFLLPSQDDIYIGFNAGKDYKYNPGRTDDNKAMKWGSIFLGERAGMNSDTAGAIMIGSDSGVNQTGYQNILIGDNAGVYELNRFIATQDPNFSRKAGERNVVLGNQNITDSRFDKSYINDTVSVGTMARSSATQGIAIGSAFVEKSDSYSESRSNLDKSAVKDSLGAIVEGQRGIAIGASNANQKKTILKDNNEINVNVGARAFGDDSIALGTDTTTAGANSIVMGKNSRVEIKDQVRSKNQKDLNSKLANSIVIGSDSNISSKNSAIFGNTNNITAQNSYAIGNNNEVTSDNTYVLGSNVEKTTKNSLFLGNDSAYVADGDTTKGTTKYTQDKIGNLNHNFSGGDNVAGVVSVGSQNQTRRIQNVAPGLISDKSTDAINGSQLYATNQILSESLEALKNTLGGNAKIDPDSGAINFTNIGNTGKNNINDAIHVALSSGGTGGTTIIQGGGDQIVKYVDENFHVLDKDGDGYFRVDDNGNRINANGQKISKAIDGKYYLDSEVDSNGKLNDFNWNDNLKSWTKTEVIANDFGDLKNGKNIRDFADEDGIVGVVNNGKKENYVIPNGTFTVAGKELSINELKKLDEFAKQNGLYGIESSTFSKGIWYNLTNKKVEQDTNTKKYYIKNSSKERLYLGFRERKIGRPQLGFFKEGDIIKDKNTGEWKTTTVDGVTVYVADSDGASRANEFKEAVGGQGKDFVFEPKNIASQSGYMDADPIRAHVIAPNNSSTNPNIYLGNVKGGILSNDAVNVAQLKKYNEHLNDILGGELKNDNVTDGSADPYIDAPANGWGGTGKKVLNDALTDIKNSTDKGLKFNANKGDEYTAKLGTQISIKGATANTDWAKFDNGENIMTNINGNNIVVGLSKDLKNINSITTEDKGTLTINAGDNKKYTFGDKNLVDTSVITNKDLTTKVTEAVGASKFDIKGDNSSKGEVKLSEGLSVVGGADSGITTAAENGKLTLSLNTDKVKTIATEGLDEKYLKIDGGNIKGDETKKSALGKNVGTDDITNGGTKLVQADAVKNYTDTISTSLTDKGLKFNANKGDEYTAKLGTQISIKGATANTDWAKFDNGENIMTNINGNNIVVGLSKDLKNINSITTEDKGTLTINAGTKKYTFDNGDNKDAGTNVVTNQELKNAINNINTQVGNVNLKIAADEGGNSDVNLKTGTLKINGDSKNITTSIENGEVKVALKDEINLGNVGENKINLGKDGLKITQADGSEGPSITAKGITMNNKQITGLKSGLDGLLGQNGKDGTIADYKKLSDSEKEKYKHNAATIGDLATVDGKIVNVSTNINNIIGNTYITDDGNGNKTIDVDKIKEDLATNSAYGKQQVVADGTGAIDMIVSSIKNINTQGTRFFHVNDGQVKGTGGLDKDDSSADSKGGVAIGIQAKVGDNAKNAISIGTNSITSVAGGVALGSYSQANRKALDDTTKKDVYLFDNQAVADTVANTKGAISVGSEVGNKFTRQITGVAAGTQDSDAVNVAQLKAVQKIANQGSKWIAADNHKFDKNGKIVDNNTPAEAKGVNSVAIGAGSNTKVVSNGKVAERPNTVSVGGLNKDGTVTQRTISNVAPGVLNSDAATMGQLRAGLNDVYGKLGEYKKDASAGTASALAVGNLPQATIPGKGMVSLGSGFYDGQSAMAIGLSKMSDSGKWVFKGSASYDSQEKAGAALSVGFHF
ncbi:Uncharacterised protein [Campylobacter ureolyticus]|uniref:Uncharacterized protein n=1 Tax=Campylobacter ureolyticus TaxID=827 RepID=A0A6N2S2B3_9BACT